MIKLSKASKMPCKSFSLPVNDIVCKGRYQESGELKEVCKACYAAKGRYRMPAAQKVRADNYTASLHHTFASQMIRILSKEKSNYFRWFDSGDIYSQSFLEKVLQICVETPGIKHWIPTKSRELFNQDTWERLESLPNVRVRYSSPDIGWISGIQLEGYGSIVISKIAGEQPMKTNRVFTCPSSTQGNKCSACRACWSKRIEVIEYIKH